MKNKTTHQINKETRIENLDALRRAVDNRTLLEVPTPDNEWGGGYVIITSSSLFSEISLMIERVSS